MQQHYFPFKLASGYLDFARKCNKFSQKPMSIDPTWHVNQNDAISPCISFNSLKLEFAHLL